MMNRRTVIKNLALVISGAALLPSCIRHNAGPSIHLKHLNLTGDQESLIGEICETIIPKTNIPGAKDLNLHLFVLKMLDDCYKKKDQQSIMKGLAEFTELVTKKYNKSFTELDVKDREAVLTGIERAGKLSSQGNKQPSRGFRPQKYLAQQPLSAFYWSVKQQTIFGYTTSQFFMTKEIVYELVPGRYNAHFPVKNLKTA